MRQLSDKETEIWRFDKANWRNKRKEGNAFVVRVAKQPKVFLIGTEEDIA